MDSTGAETTFTHAASFASTTAIAIFRAARRLPQVTNTIFAFLFRAMVVFSVAAFFESRFASFHVDSTRLHYERRGTNMSATPGMVASPIKFGTSGWRGLIADDFTFANVRLAVTAIAEHIKAKSAKPTILVGYDTRFYSEEF